MELSSFDCGVLDRIVKLFYESFSWVKTQIESFFKLLRTDLITALLTAKPLVIKCCEKFKLALSSINDLTDGKFHKLSEAEKPSKSPEEISFVEESKKLIQKMGKLVGQLTICADPELRRKGEIMKGFLVLAQGFTELLEISFNQPLKVVLILVDGYLLYRNCAITQVSQIGCKFANYKEKAVVAIAALLTLFSVST